MPYLIIIFILLAGPAVAQQCSGLHFMRDTGKVCMTAAEDAATRAEWVKNEQLAAVEAQATIDAAAAKITSRKQEIRDEAMKLLRELRLIQ